MRALAEARVRREAERREKKFRAAQKPSPESLIRGLKPAIGLIDANRFDEARDMVADFLERRPGSAAGHSLLIRIHGMLGEAELSEHLFEYAKGNGMGSRDLYGAMVDAYSSCREFGKAQAVIAEAEACGLGCAKNYAHLMAGLYGEGRYEDVERVYLSLPISYKSKAALNIKYADALRKMKRYGEAKEAAEFSISLRSTLAEKTKARIIIGYCEMCLGNPEKAYKLLREEYEKVSRLEDGGFSQRFFPRLLCGVVFACSKAGIPQPDSTAEQWRRLLERIQEEGRGNAGDIGAALMRLRHIPAAPAQHEL